MGLARRLGVREGKGTRSCRVEEAPCIAAPPETLTLVFGAGDEVREFVRKPVRTLGRSEISGPDADGGFFGDELPDAGAGSGSWRASGLSERAKALAKAGSLGACLRAEI